MHGIIPILIHNIKNIKKSSKNTTMNCQGKLHKEKSSSTTPMVVQMDFALWNYLLQGTTKKPRHRYSKIEAYYDLLSRHRLMILDGSDDEYMNASLQDLANSWSWDRGAVRRFIEALSDMEAVTLDTDYSRNNKTVIRLNNISGLTPIKEDRPQVKTIDSESASDSTISGRTPTTQGGHGA